MTNYPGTPLRAVRINDELWGAATRAAARQGETLSDAIRGFLREYAELPERHTKEFEICPGEECSSRDLHVFHPDSPIYHLPS